MIGIGPLLRTDPTEIASAFDAIGWNKPQYQYERYLAGQAARARTAMVARWDGMFAGYVTVLWTSAYEGFQTAGVPEISDLNVLPKFRRRGIASALMDTAEATIAHRGETAGLGVGLYPDYGPAQRLYALRGYLPDGRGVAWRGLNVAPMAAVSVDDDLVLFMKKTVR